MAEAAFNVHQAKTQFSRLLRRVEDGDDIVIAKAGTPVARLIPYNATLALDRKLGSLEEQRLAYAQQARSRDAELYAVSAEFEEQADCFDDV